MGKEGIRASKNQKQAAERKYQVFNNFDLEEFFKH
jgi:hypothetical protein